MAEKEEKKEEKKEAKIEEKEYNFYEAFTKALAEMPEKLPMVEGQIGHRKYNYTPLDKIVNTVRPILAKYGLAITQEIQTSSINEPKVMVSTIIYDKKGHKLSTPWVESQIVETVGGNQLQALGATITYLRRYSISAFLNIATEEDTDATNVMAEKNYKFISKSTKDKRKELPEEMKEKINEIWQKVKEARDLGILDDEIALKQREALKKVSTWSGVEALEKAIYRLIEVEHQRKANQLKEEAKEAANEDFTETGEIGEVEPEYIETNDLPL